MSRKKVVPYVPGQEWINLIGMRVVALRGIRRRKSEYDRRLTCELRYILFNDEETYIEFDEQDYYTYHDCASSARHVSIRKDKEKWKQLMEKITWRGSTKTNLYSYDEPDDFFF